MLSVSVPFFFFFCANTFKMTPSTLFTITLIEQLSVADPENPLGTGGGGGGEGGAIINGQGSSTSFNGTLGRFVVILNSV